MSVIDLGSTSSEADEDDMENGGVRLRTPTGKPTATARQAANPRLSFCNVELRHMTCGFPLAPAQIDVILVVGPSTDIHIAVCERFANDFEYYHLDLPTYLRSLFASGRYNDRSLGLLHPHAFREFMQKGQEAEIPEGLLAQIAKLKIDVEVQRNNRRKFLISGLGTAAGSFDKDVANYSAIFLFSDAPRYQRHSVDILNLVSINSSGMAVESSYQELLRAIYLRAGQPEMELENVEMM